MELVLAVHKYELLVPALGNPNKPHNPRRKSSGVDVNDEAAVAKWLESEKQGGVNSDAIDSLQPVDVLLRMGKSFQAEVLKTIADKIFPSDTSYIVPDTKGRHAVVVDEAGVIFDIFGFASACSPAVKARLDLLEEPITCLSRHLDPIDLDWPPLDKSLKDTLEDLWGHLRV